MTPQENQVLQELLDQLARAKLATKDPQAQALISRALEQQPDAGYLLVQRALLLEQALKQAQAQIAQLQEQGSTFLGGASRWSQSPAPVAQAAPAPAYAAPVGAAGQGTGSGKWGSFLGSAAATAAGVAGGAFLFRGLEDLFSHGGDANFGRNEPTVVDDVTINNYGVDAASSDFSSAADADAGLDESDLDQSSDDSSWT